jgi:hypothetical protein
MWPPTLRRGNAQPHAWPGTVIAPPLLVTVLSCAATWTRTASAGAGVSVVRHPLSFRCTPTI